MTPYAHYVARAQPGRYPFADASLARDFWARLRRSFPDAIAAVLMPNHLHMVAPDRGSAGARILGKLLGAVARASPLWSGRGRWWEPVEPPDRLVTPDKVMRVTRYGWLNPCRPWRYRGHRIQLVDDPLCWSWSTLRDSIGAVCDPWVPAERVAIACGWARTADLPERLHAHATRDEHVSPEARRFPTRHGPKTVPVCTMEEVLKAALASTRRSAEDLRRRGAARRVAAGLAYDQGWSRPKQLAPLLDVHPKSIPRLVREASPDEVRAAALCLDARLGLDPDRTVRAANVESF